MHRLTSLIALVGLIACAMPVHAEPPYDITFNYSPPSTGGVVDGYNGYVDDCDVAGPTGAPDTTVEPGVPVPGLITADGTYDFCARAFNGTGEQPDPGVIVTVSINQEPLPGPIDTLDIDVTCRSGGVVVNCADAGVNVNVTTN